MSRKFENFSFDNISLDEFKDDIDDINNTFNDLMKDRKIKKIYNKVKKIRDKENEIERVTYNRVNDYNGFDLRVLKNKEIKLNNNSEINEYGNEKISMIFG